MIAIDTNVLVHAHRSDTPFHKNAFKLLKKYSEGKEPWAIPYPCLHEFYSIITHPKIFKHTTPEMQAISQLQAWVSSNSIILLSERKSYLSYLTPLLTAHKVRGALVHDARIIALCLQEGIKSIYTFDRDFSRFKEITTLIPPN